VSSEDGNSNIKLEGESSTGGVETTSKVVLRQKILPCLPGCISERLENLSEQSRRRCCYGAVIALALFIGILAGVLSVTADQGQGVDSSHTSSQNSNGADKSPVLTPSPSASSAPQPHITMVPGTGSTFQDATVTTPPFSVTDFVSLGGPTTDPTAVKPSLRPLPTVTPLPVPDIDSPTNFQCPTSITPVEDPASNPQHELPPGSITYSPGNLTHMEHGLLLSEGLRARIIAQSGLPVTYENGQNSSRVFHGRPDAGATFAEIRPFNEGGWVYVSNSEMRVQDPPGGSGNGGVGAITFNKHGNPIMYYMILENTTWNCGGGKTAWDSWVSCEENFKSGQLYQVSPFGVREPEVLTLGKDGGRFESFAYDISNLNEPHFFVTEDRPRGALRKFTPFEKNINWTDPWNMLHGNGTTEYLILNPNDQRNGGSFQWSTNIQAARRNAKEWYPQTEGIDTHNGRLYFVCKEIKVLFELDLEEMTYTNTSTKAGLFDGGPDQIVRILDRQKQKDGVIEQGDADELLYFTEEDGIDAGVQGRSKDGKFFTILESPVYFDEVTGLAFSPDNKHMYIAYQANGILFDIYREDGYPFHAKSLAVKYHKSQGKE